jgi:hypothetical protein
MQTGIRHGSTFAAAAALVLLHLSSATIVAAAETDGARREAAEVRMEELKQRLALSPEQQAQLVPLVEARNVRLRDLRESNGGDQSRRARFKLMKQARKVQEDFTAQVEPILTQEQQVEWAKIRSEVRAAAKERMRERR